MQEKDGGGIRGTEETVKGCMKIERDGREGRRTAEPEKNR